MKKTFITKTAAGFSVATIGLLMASQAAFAHTRFETSTVAEGTRVHNYVNIGHGCPPSNARKATMGTSVVFPNAINYDPVVAVDKGDGAGKVYVGGKDIAKATYSPLAGIGALIRPVDAWPDHNNIKVDQGDNKDGFWAGGKAYDQSISTSVVVPFYSAAVSIAKASCAKSVTFYATIIDFCSIDKPSTSATDEDLLIWSAIPLFPVNGVTYGAKTADPAHSPAVPAGPAYSDYDGYKDAAHTQAGDGWGSPASLKITRNTTTNPLPGNCGSGWDYHVYPSSAQVNAELPVYSGYHQDGQLIWK